MIRRTLSRSRNGGIAIPRRNLRSSSEWPRRSSGRAPERFPATASTRRSAHTGSPATFHRSTLSGLYGAIYHAFGKEGAFAAMSDVRKLLPMYDAALRKRSDLLRGCYVLPDSTLSHARSLEPRQ